MQKNEFDNLSIEEKKYFLFKAEKIEQFFDGTVKAELFKMADFYVEALYDFKRNMLRSIHAVDHIPAIFKKLLVDHKRIAM